VASAEGASRVRGKNQTLNAEDRVTVLPLTRPSLRSGHPLPASRGEGDHAAAADLPIAALTRGMTSSAINCMERLFSAGSTQSMPA
jgi:hypothetical protein